MTQMTLGLGPREMHPKKIFTDTIQTLLSLTQVELFNKGKKESCTILWIFWGFEEEFISGCADITSPYKKCCFINIKAHYRTSS